MGVDHLVWLLKREQHNRIIYLIYLSNEVVPKVFSMKGQIGKVLAGEGPIKDCFAVERPHANRSMNKYFLIMMLLRRTCFFGVLRNY